MKQYINITDFYIDKATVLTIGKFDGEHIGHRKLLEVMKRVAEERGLKTAVFTFNTAPSEIVGGVKSRDADLNPGQITTNDERNKMLNDSGIDYLIEYPFNKEISCIRAEDFIKDILIKKMNMKAVVAGPDCAFGYKKEGNAELLKKVAKKLPKELSYEVIIIDKEKDEHDRDISSTLIREELDKGNIENANRLLGTCYSIHGKVLHGNMIGGKLLGFPTANIIPQKRKHLPRFGVYASKVRLINSGEEYFGLTNVGINPTVDNDKDNHAARVETFIYDFNKDIYGAEIEISFIKFIRPEKKFSSLEELKKQIADDKETVKNIFGKDFSKPDIIGNKLIHVWSKQHENVYEILQKTGSYTAQKEHISKELGEDAALVLEAYDWLAAHTPPKKNGRPPDADYPIWVTVKNETVMLPEPGYVIMELEIDSEIMTKVNIGKWGNILNYSYIASDAEDALRHDKLLKEYRVSDTSAYMSQFYPQIKREIIKSWDRLFDDNVILDNKNYYGNIWEIKKEWIKKIIR